MPTARNDTNASGLTFWSDEPTPGAPHDVDIVAVQGLGAHAYYTWVRKVSTTQTTERTKGKRPSRGKTISRLFGKKSRSPDDHDGYTTKEVMWLRDLLAPEFTNARVATYSYGSDWRDRQVNTSLWECGQQLLEVLLQHRQGASEKRRPLILLGHSLGGLVIQQALTIAVHGIDYTDIRASVAGAIFLGTPFQGSSEAVYAQWLAKLIRLQEAEGHKYTLLKTLQKDCATLRDMLTSFWRSYSDYDMTCFYENRGADYGPVKRQFVSKQSATLVGQKMMYMDADHSGLNKFGGADDSNFVLLLPELRRMIENSGQVVEERYRSKDNGVAGNVHWMVPRIVNSRFTGRSEVLERMQSALRNNGPEPTKQTRIVITGIGGMGKSEVCLKTAELVQAECASPAGSSGVCFWVDVGRESTATNDFITIAKVIGSSAKSVDEARQSLTNTKKRWLLILDNADDVDFDYARYIPSGVQGAIILTSRNPQCSQYSTSLAVALEGLDAEHSMQLLLRAAKIPEKDWQSHETQAQAQDIVSLLGSHTLALIQAGAYVAEGFCQLAEYPKKYRQHRKRLLEHHPKQEQSRYQNVFATFEASADALDHCGSQEGRDALDLLAVLCMLHSGALPLAVFEAAWRAARKVLRDVPAETERCFSMPSMVSAKRWHVAQYPRFVDTESDEWDDYCLKQASARLESLSLVTRHAWGDDSHGLSMHPLAHAWAKERLEKEQQRRAWATAGCLLTLSMWEMYLCDFCEIELRPHVLSLLSASFPVMLSCGPQEEMLAVLLRCGFVLNWMREDARLEQLLSDIYQAFDITPTDPSREHMLIWDLAAKNMRNMGQGTESADLLERIVEIRGTTLNERHRDLLDSQHQLAITYTNNGQTTKAIELLKHVLKIRGLLSSNELYTGRLDVQYALGYAYLVHGQVEQAIELLEHVVKIGEESLYERHPDQLASQHLLGRAYLHNGQTKQAVELLEHVVKMEETLDERSPNWLASQYLLASAYIDNGQTKQAVELHEHVVKIEETLDERYPDQLASQRELGRAYLDSGQTKQAVELLEHVLKIEATLDERHPNRLASQHLLGRAYLDNGQTKQAVELLEHVVKIEETLDERYPDWLASQRDLGEAYLNNGQTKQAVELLEQIVKMEETLDERDLNWPMSQYCLVRAYVINGQRQQAIELLEHVVKISRATLSADHPNRLGSESLLEQCRQSRW